MEDNFLTFEQRHHWTPGEVWFKLGQEAMIPEIRTYLAPSNQVRMKIGDTLKRNVSFDGDNADQPGDLNGFPSKYSDSPISAMDPIGFVKVGR